MIVGEEPEPEVVPSQQKPAEEPPDEEPEDDKATAVLRAMITTSINKDLKIERDRVIKRAAIEPTTFTKAIEDFYTTWTAQTGDGLTAVAARKAIQHHADTSMRALKDAESVSTTESLKANVRDVVASWDSRAEILIDSLMKAVQ